MNQNQTNNIFLGQIRNYTGGGCTTYAQNDAFTNNICTTTMGTSLDGMNFINIPQESIFIDQSGQVFNFSHNYHLKPESIGKNAGTDGSDVGLYGGQSYTEGAVPSNPHIYFKQVAPQTNSNGQLQIQFKVRTNN